MKEIEMAKELTDMGYDVDLNLDNETFNSMLVAEMAVNEGYTWNDVTELWVAEGEENIAPFDCPLCEANTMEYKPVENEDALTGVTHKWVCMDCPAILMEYYTQADVEAL